MKNGGTRGAIRDLEALFNEGAVGMLSDGQLLDRFVERCDASAFELILERHGPLVWGVCRRVLRDHHDAEDAFQATFLVLARKAASVMPREKLGNWLYGVAFQTAMNARATRTKRRARDLAVRDMTQPSPVSDVHVDELIARLDREVARLPEKYRLPTILCELEGKTHRQAAEQLGWPVGTVSGRLSRAKALLADRMSRPGAPLGCGAFAALLAHDAAQAAMPPTLISATARAATLTVAGKALTSGVVSTQVAALTQTVLKSMLIHKLTLIAPLLFVVFAVALGGSSLTLRAQATEPSHQPSDTQRANEQTNSTNTIEPIQRPRSPERLTGENPKLLSLAESAQRPIQPSLSYCGYSFTATPTGNRALAYNIATRKVKAVLLNATQDQPLKVTPVRMDAADMYCQALRVEGPKITRVALFDLKSGEWFPLDLDTPTSGIVQPMSIQPDAVAYEIGDFLYMFSAKDRSWNRMDLRPASGGKYHTAPGPPSPVIPIPAVHSR